MDKTRTTSDLPLRPMGHGDTLVQVFRSAAEQGAAEGELEPTPAPRSPPRRSRGAEPSLQRRIFEADGRPVRLGRYDVLRCVGAGGMGVVYEAVHVEHGHRVALKTLRWMTAAGLSRFKNEFRSLCGIAHPSLCALYELGVDDDEWFFTMELVEGESFIEHVQSASARPLGGWEYLGETLADELPSGPHDTPDARATTRSTPRGLVREIDAATTWTSSPSPRAAGRSSPDSGAAWGRSFHEGRLRAAFRQLAASVAALHDCGKLHRDLNPGNVLVTREGRVVVLDFGLVCDRARRPGAPYDGACGTPAYMSPEQAAGKPAVPASDWYGVGVMLFEALTGQLPFTGSAGRMLGNKRLHEAPPPSQLAPGLPPDLEALCVALLRRAPEERPGAAEVLEVLGASPRRARPPAPSAGAFFAGRRAELAALDDALGSAAAGRAVPAGTSPPSPVTVVLHGPPGSGKTSLLGRFLDETAARPTAIVLACVFGARESIPHRMLDPLVDALAAQLSGLPEAEVRAVLPEGARALVRLFPVLGGLPAIADLPRPAAADREGASPDDPPEVERAALACLRELLARLAAARTVVIAVDDAHLADPEGARELAGLLSPAPWRGTDPATPSRSGLRPQTPSRWGLRPQTPAAPPAPAGAPSAVLLLLAHDDESLASSPVLAEISRALGETRRVALGPLSAEEARELALRVLPPALPGREALAAEIAAASEGSPLAVGELCLHAGEARGPVSLDEVVAARLARLPEHALRLVEVAAAAAGPIERGLLLEVAGAGPLGDTAIPSLTAARLLHAASSGADGEERLAIHDARTRAVVAARTTSASARRIHLALGHALVARPGADPDAAAAYFARAGAYHLCAAHLSAAAEQATAARDHDRAAALLERAIASSPRGSREARALLARRAEALAAAARPVEAADTYLKGAAGAPRAEALSLQRQAAEHLLVAGHVDRGLGELRPVLDAHGVRWPETGRRASWALSARLLELRLRGARLPWSDHDGGPPHTPGAPAGPSSPHVEVLWSAGKALATLDPLRSALFVVEALRAALAARDAEHAALALSLAGSMLVAEGAPADEARGLDLIDEAARFARRRGDARLTGFSWFCSGLARLSVGRFREALARLDEALGLLEEHGGGLAWERQVHRAASLRALLALGSFAERGRRADAWLRDARARGDRAGEALSTLVSGLLHLASGDPAAARAAARQSALPWRGVLGPSQYAALTLEVSTYLYEGNPTEAHARLLASWPALSSSHLLRFQLVRIEALHLRGLTAVASGRPDLHRHVELDAAALAREKRPHALASAALLRAGLARARGEIARALDHLDEAARGYASAEMSIHAAAVRRARGALLGGPAGRTLVAEADAVLAAEGVRDGARWAAMMTGLGR